MDKNHSYPLTAPALLALLLVVFACQTLYAQTFTVLYDFGGKTGDPLLSESGLVQGGDGALYGTSGSGGAHNSGSLFKVIAPGTVRVLYDFCAQLNCADGNGPLGLTLRPDGHFLGATIVGGASDRGTIFDITQAGNLTQLYNFTGGADGAYPWSITLGPDGDFYGIAFNGGNRSSCGTAFSLVPTPTGALFYLLHKFAQAIQGCGPDSLALGRDGNFYGTTFMGGSSGFGTVFKMTRKGTVTVLHTFDGVNDGYYGHSLILGNDGNFYGTTLGIGPPYAGTIFKITPNGTFTVLHTMATDGSEGTWLYSGLVQGSDGNFYGAAEQGGTNNAPCFSGCGTLYEITPAGAFTLLHDFDFTDGYWVDPIPFQHTNGLIYGGTTEGGLYGGGFCGTVNCGILYSLDNSLPPFVLPVPYAERVGIPVEILGQGFTSATTVNFNGTPAAAVKVSSPTRVLATVPSGATTGYVTVTTSSGTLTSKQPFIVAP